MSNFLDDLANSICVTSCGGCPFGRDMPLCEKCVFATLRANGLPEKYADKIRDLPRSDSGNVHGTSWVIVNAIKEALSLEGKP